MILAPSIEYVQLMNETQAAPELTSFAALGLIEKYPLPHYQCFPFVENRRDCTRYVWRPALSRADHEPSGDNLSGAESSPS